MFIKILLIIGENFSDERIHFSSERTQGERTRYRPIHKFKEKYDLLEIN
jgi:hypothetical protein